MSQNGGHFLTTCWTQVLAVQGASTQAGAALADLCAAYYSPVQAYITRTTQDLGDTRDLTQEFFTQLLAGALLAGADRERGRFRSYLLGAVKHFLADKRDRRGAAKRGSQYEHVDAEGALEIADDGVPTEVWFDRQWGYTVLGLALTSLEAEHQKQNKSAQFHLLKPWLTGDAVSLADIAIRLGLSEGALKVAIHRLRKRFKESVKAEIAQTVSNQREAREELRYLIEVVASHGALP